MGGGANGGPQRAQARVWQEVLQITGREKALARRERQRPEVLTRRERQRPEPGSSGTTDFPVGLVCYTFAVAPLWTGIRLLRLAAIQTEGLSICMGPAPSATGARGSWLFRSRLARLWLFPDHQTHNK